MSRVRVRTGLGGRCDGIAAPEHGGLRLTVPAREALLRAGNRVVCIRVVPAGAETWDVTLCGSVPPGLVLDVLGDATRALRLDDEPGWPGAYPDSVVAWNERGEWIPCPMCGAALVWWEAGYVPGYRICARAPHHHAQLSEDGRTAATVVSR